MPPAQSEFIESNIQPASCIQILRLYLSKCLAKAPKLRPEANSRRANRSNGTLGAACTIQKTRGLRFFCLNSASARDRQSFSLGRTFFVGQNQK
jgi:hypothetical protein